MYKSLQAGRAVAAAMVVLFHLGGSFAQTKYFGFKPLDVPFAWCDAGVEFFFVLSGFLIATIHRRDIDQPEALGPYLLKRTLRIYPTYWVVCLGVCLAALAVPSLRDALPSDPLVFLKGLALIPQDPDLVGGTGAPILFIAWSLQYELLFYAVTAVFIASRAAGIVVIAGLLVIKLVSETFAPVGFPWSFLSSNLIFLFAMGVAAAHVVRSDFRLRRPKQLAFIAIAAFVSFGALEMVIGRETLWFDRRLVYGLLGAIIIVALVQAESRGLLTLKHRAIPLLGDASYALYLLHIPVISVLCKFFARMNFTGAVPIIGVFILIFVACIAASIAFHLLIEKPMLARLSRHRAGPRRPANTPVARLR